MNNARIEEILKSVEHHHEQYLKNLRLLFESQLPGSRTHRAGSGDGTSLGPLKAGSPGQNQTLSQTQPTSERARRPTNESPRFQPVSVLDSLLLSGEESAEFLPLTPPSRAFSAKPSEPLVTSVSRPLPQESFSDEDLAAHIRSVDEASQDTVTALGDAWQRRHELDASNIFASFETGEGSRYDSASYEFYEVDGEGTPSRMLIQAEQQAHSSGGDADGDNRDSSVWNVLKAINSDGKAVGRVTILQEPSPLMLAATHMTMQSHFDMDELFQHLVSTEGNKGKTKAYMNRAFETDPLRQRTFFFIFKYYTVVGEGLTPAPWQAFDDRPPDRRSPDHIDITECSSVLALSLGGDPTGTVKIKVKRKTRTGVLYDSFAPWHLLNIQCFPDDEHSMRSDDSKKHFCNGPYAFLDALCVEYKDAVKRYTQLNEMITKLITPPNQFMFDVRLRDKLLFEDSHFTYSRRYFWAYNTLGVINEGIKSMRTAYLGTFTKDFWAGRHPTLWPHPSPDSADGREYAARMDALRQELDGLVADLQQTADKNEATRTEIRSLREQLFSGSSVKESRRAIEQGDNIKILTSVSMIFLPLTFVVGVFGITTLDIPPTDWRFAATLAAVCVPFFLLILLLQTRAAMDLLRRCGLATERYLRGVLGRFLVSPAAAVRDHLHTHHSYHSHQSYHSDRPDSQAHGHAPARSQSRGNQARAHTRHSAYAHHAHAPGHGQGQTRNPSFVGSRGGSTGNDSSNVSHGGEVGHGRERVTLEAEGPERYKWRRRLRMARAARRERAGAAAATTSGNSTAAGKGPGGDGEDEQRWLLRLLVRAAGWASLPRGWKWPWPWSRSRRGMDNAGRRMDLTV